MGSMYRKGISYWKLPLRKMANRHMVDEIRAVPFIRSVALTYAPFTRECQGVHEFIDDMLPTIRANNPQVEWLVYPSYAHYVDPWIEAKYEFDRRRNMRLLNKTAAQVLSVVEMYAHGGSFLPKKKGRYGVRTFVPRGQVLLNVETKGHDVFKLHSKHTAKPQRRDAGQEAAS